MCNFLSNGYYGQVMCMWTGLVALGAGLRHDEFVRAGGRSGVHIFCLWGSLWRLFGSNTGENCTGRSCFMYEKVIGWFCWSVVAIVALRFG